LLLLATKSARERLVIFLLDIARRLRADRFSLPMPRTGIADHLGMTRETVSRTLSGLSREGLIRLESTDRVLLRDRTGLKRVMLEEKV
jgi:CRP-like cAMP-binding protein